MADDDDQGQHPLLSHAGEDAAWDQVESAPPVKAGPAVQGLIAENPEKVLRTLQREGVQLLGEFRIEDRLVLGRLGDDSIVTMGADRPDIDYEAAWRRELGSSSTTATGATGGSSDGCKAGWVGHIPVLAYVVIIKNAAAPDREGLINPLLKRWQAGGCSMGVFALPAVQAVIDWKWTRFCKRLLLWELACFLFWMAAFFVWAAAFQDEDASLTLKELLATPRGKLTVAMDVLALVGMVPFLVIEVSTVLAYGWGWFSIWNTVDCCTYTLQIVIVIMHLGRLNIDSSWISIAAALQVIFLLFRLQYFSRVFRATRFSFLDDLREVVGAVKWYLVFILLIMLGFASAFQILYRKDQAKHKEFESVGSSFMLMVTWLAGNADLTPLTEHAHNPVAGALLGVMFVFVLAMVLGNLLIGIMTNTLERVTKNEGLRMLLSKAQVIDELESTIPHCVERLFPGLYPPFIHVLRVDPQKLDTVKVDELWGKRREDQEAIAEDGGGGGEEGEDEGAPAAATSKAGSNVGGNQQGSGSDDGAAAAAAGVKRLEGRLDEVQQDLQELKQLLLALRGEE